MANNSSCWYCPKCKEELDGCHVTYQELCEYCGTAVLSVPESISQETIEEIIKAKADGRLVVLPCKVGDTVYWADNDIEMSCVHTGVVDNFCVDNEEGKLWCYVRYNDGLRYHHRVDAFFGKTVFLSRDEAEKAIAEVGE